jgi:hypothetical protein
MTFEQQVLQAKQCVIQSVKALYDGELKDSTETDATRRHRAAAQSAVALGEANQQIGRYLALQRLTGPDQYRFLLDVQESRSDLQVGNSSASKSATTSIVTKGTLPSVLGFAVEHGALDREISGSSVTFRVNPTGLVQALNGLGFQESYDQTHDDTVLKVLNKSSLAVTFDTSQGGQPGTLVATSQQVSSWALGYQIINHRDPRDERYKKLWSGFLENEGNALALTGQAFFMILQDDPEIKAWQKNLETQVMSAPEADFERLTQAAFDKLEAVNISRPVAVSLANFMTAIENSLSTREKIRATALKGSLATLNYTVLRDPQLPDLSDIRFIAATSAAGRMDLTMNAGISFFNKESPTISNRIRSYEFSGQLDLLVGNTTKVGGMTLSAAWRFQNLPEDTMLPGFTETVKKGVINTGQLKFTVPIKGSGMRIPISFTAANRSELISEKKFLSASVGITFDFDSILAKLTP